MHHSLYFGQYKVLSRNFKNQKIRRCEIRKKINSGTCGGAVSLLSLSLQ